MRTVMKMHQAIEDMKRIVQWASECSDHAWVEYATTEELEASFYLTTNAYCQPGLSGLGTDYPYMTDLFNEGIHPEIREALDKLTGIADDRIQAAEKFERVAGKCWELGEAVHHKKTSAPWEKKAAAASRRFLKQVKEVHKVIKKVETNKADKCGKAVSTVYHNDHNLYGKGEE